MANRGLGHVYLRGNTYWIKYHKDGAPFYESSHSSRYKDAVALLKTRINAPVVVKTGPVLVGELLDDLEVYYQVTNPKSAAWGARMAKYLRPFWGQRRADKVTTTAINEYIKQRKSEAVRTDELGPASINRELAILRKALNLGRDATPPKVGFVPKIITLKEPPARKGFLEYEQYRALFDALPEELRLPLVIGYFTGARFGEVLSIQLHQVDMRDKKIRLYDTKRHSEGRWLPIYGEMLDATAQQVEAIARDYPHCPWLSHRRGNRIISIRVAWDSACKAVGLPDLLFHDLRRSAVRNMVRAGIPEKVAMKISGHKTRSVFDRYNIVDNRDIEDAGKRMEEFFRRQA
jgi:integrase